jgi:hypothetical protein|tara:strand:- start:544 stop:744 length:201 start_codon:yes stop_codon:yes gene_type:complete
MATTKKNLRLLEKLDSKDYDLLSTISELSADQKRAIEKALGKRKGGTVSRKKGSKIIKGYKAGGKV